MTAAISDSLIGTIIADRYEVIRKIAKGGMGTIYEVRNTRLGRTFALKTITAEAAQDPEVLQRFRREADVVANLSHPHIVEVVDWDQLDDGAPFLVMEYLRGETLAARIAGVGALPWGQIAQVADQVLSALGVAHRAGVVHRDLKPDNIFLAVDDAGEERVKLLDFGISKIRDSQTFQTTDAKVLGTPAYMAPEQAEGQHDKIGAATDVWAMGAIIYEMITGAVAFSAPSTPAILYRVCHGRPTPANELRPDVPKELVELLDWALDLQLRLDNVEELREELKKILSKMEGVTWAPLMRSRVIDSVRKSTPIGVRMSTPLPIARPSGRISKAVYADGTPPPQDIETARSMVQPAPATASSSATHATSVDVADTSRDLNTVPGVAITAIPPPQKSRVPLMIGGAAAFVISAVVVFAVTRNGSEPDTQTEPLAPQAQLVAPTQPPPPPPAAPVLVDIKIDSVPAGADVFRMPSELKVGVTPWGDQVEQSDGIAVFVVKSAGFLNARVELDLRAGGAQTVTLKRRAAATVRRVPVRPPTPTRRKGEPVNPFEKKPK
jgi:serine/threonine-protein kinase